VTDPHTRALTHAAHTRTHAAASTPPRRRLHAPPRRAAPYPAASTPRLAVPGAWSGLKTGPSGPFLPLSGPERNPTSLGPERILVLSFSFQSLEGRRRRGTREGGAAVQRRRRRRRPGGFGSPAAAVHSGSPVLTGKFPVALLLSLIS